MWGLVICWLSSKRLWVQPDNYLCLFLPSQNHDKFRVRVRQRLSGCACTQHVVSPASTVATIGFGVYQYYTWL